MAVQTPANPAEFDLDLDVEAGVIEDARARQKRHRRIGAAFLTAAIAAGLIITGLGGGSGGSGEASAGHGHGASPGAAAHPSPQVSSALTGVPPYIGQFGLLSPRVGWAANGVGLFLTRDGGTHWSTLTVPKLTGGDVVADLITATSPDPRELILAFGTGGSIYGSCADPAGRTTRQTFPAGYVAVGGDSARIWHTVGFPDCTVPNSLSFINAAVGFASAQRRPRHPSLLFKTIDAGRRWQRAGVLPSAGAIDFTSRQDGWLSAPHRLYETTDGGSSWQVAAICQTDATQSVTIHCGAPHFDGSDGAVMADAHNALTGHDQPLVYTTVNGGQHWSQHRLHVSQKRQAHIAPAFSTPNRSDLFVGFTGGLLASSTDGGHTWTSRAAPKLGAGPNRLDFVSARYGWLQTDGHLDSTTNGGQSWRRLGGQ